MRAFVSAFGDEVIGAGHTVNVQAVEGKRIRAFYDEFGSTLGGFDLA